MDGHPEIPPPEIKKKETSETVYLRLLGLSEMPDSPDDLPDELNLPPRVLGFLAKSIEETRADNRERSQLIFWNKFLHDYQPDRVKLGSEEKDGVENTGLINRYQDLIKTSLLGDKALISEHTHPDKKHSSPINSFPSETDITQWARFPNESFIHLVGSGDGIVAITQTKQSMKSKSELSTDTVKLFEQYLEGRIILNAQQIGEALKNEGFGFYVWFAADAHKGITKAETAQLQDQGVKLLRSKDTRKIQTEDNPARSQNVTPLVSKSDLPKAA